MIEKKEAQRLKERFNPEGSPLRRMQQRMIEILLEVDRICTKHDLTYWISSGTLLGCMRHGGYIPWDDDLDIEMLRSDYDKLLEVLPHELPDHLKLQTAESDPGYFNCYAKVRDLRSRVHETNHYDDLFKYQGVFIDIFPYEKMPLPLLMLSKHTMGVLFRFIKNDRLTIGEKRKWVRRIYRCNQRFVFPILRLIARCIPTRYRNYSPGIPFDNTIVVAETLPTQRRLFEGHLLPTPHDADAYLYRKYGNYMKLPDLDKIQQHSEKIEFFDH